MIFFSWDLDLLQPLNAKKKINAYSVYSRFTLFSQESISSVNLAYIKVMERIDFPTIKVLTLSE